LDADRLISRLGKLAIRAPAPGILIAGDGDCIAWFVAWNRIANEPLLSLIFVKDNSCDSAHGTKVMRDFRCSSIVRMVLVALAVLLAVAQANAQRPSSLYTYSTIDALLAGTYDGDLTIGELGAKGNFGIGTYNRLDGEMLALDGVFYHATADGAVAPAGPQDKTPLAYVTFFHPSQTFNSETVLSLQGLESWLDGRLKNLNLFYAIRIDGIFRDVSVRAIAAQNKPYKELAEVVKTQSIHDYPTTRGTLIGIRSPAFSKGISVPGYHWHFLTEDHQHGGHVLKLTMAQGSSKVETISELELQLPRNEAFAQANQTKDRAAETKQVEGK
jgi:acetolactate decarboxylase